MTDQLEDQTDKMKGLERDVDKMKYGVPSALRATISNAIVENPKNMIIQVQKLISDAISEILGKSRFTVLCPRFCGSRR